MISIDVETVDHGEQRYETCGDWENYDNHFIIRVSDCDNWRYEALVAVHEIVEALICKSNGITQEVVDEYDMNEDGDAELPECPYHDEHAIASAVERLLAVSLGVNWSEYEKALPETR